MIRLKYSPQFSAARIHYELAGEVLTATLGGDTDTFDFTGTPDGRAEVIETTLPVQPIVRAERADGILELELVKYIGLDASEADRFPQWQEVSDGSY